MENFNKKQSYAHQIWLLSLISIFYAQNAAGDLRPYGQNVCSYLEQYATYTVQYRSVSTTEVYRTCCWHVIVCVKHCYKKRTKYVSRSFTQRVYRGRRKYKCCTGWSSTDGRECTQPICDPPCQNGGTCIRPDVCQCQSGYEGYYCQHDEDECRYFSRHQCKDICVNVPGSYYCSCKRGQEIKRDKRTCQECTEGEFKVDKSPGPCQKCPANSITRNTGSTSISDCVCKTGFTGYPRYGHSCTKIECPSLPQILNGRLLPCSRFYNEKCEYRCDDDSRIENEQGNSRVLQCLSSRKWSRDVPKCIMIRCQEPPIPSHIESQCNGNTVDSRCVYTCKRGYKMIGNYARDIVRVCQRDGQWSGSLPSCEKVTCPALVPVKGVMISPSCTRSPSRYSDGCVQRCVPGYTKKSGSYSRVCDYDGTWTGTEMVCKDETPPTIKCPPKIVDFTDPGSKFRIMSYQQATASDTSNGKVNIYQFPSTISSPYPFSIGVTTLRFVAADESRNMDDCYFHVEIKDNERPKFTFCPSDMVLEASAVDGKTQNVTWKHPKFTDNSGKAKIIFSSHSNPAFIPIGTSEKIYYTIEDAAGNSAKCIFTVHVKSKSCPARDPPTNGAITCDDGAESDLTCSVSCHYPYTFTKLPAYQYVCTEQLLWKAIPPSRSHIWPNCTEKVKPFGVSQKMKVFYFMKSCSEVASSQNEIIENFKKVFSVMLRFQPECLNPANSRICRAENIQVKCGKTKTMLYGNTVSSDEAISIDFDIEIISDDEEKIQERIVEDVTNTVQTIKHQYSSVANAINIIQVNGNTIVLEDILPVGSISLLCPNGSVVEEVEEEKNGKIKTEKQCVNCYAGSYFDFVNRRCLICPKGTYSEAPGSLECSKCPFGTTTLSSGTAKKSHCYDIRRNITYQRST